jgi:hypothetical protein
MKKIFCKIISVICICAMLLGMGLALIPANAAGATDLSGAWYEPDDSTDGFAAGLLHVRVSGWFDFNSYPTDVIAYWANGSGLLSGYDALATFSLTAISTSYRLPELMIIPEGADRIRVYLAPRGTNDLYSVYKEAMLPAGEAFVISDEPNHVFAVVSDTHVDADANPTYNSRFENMLTDVSTNIEGVEGIFINGDMINSKNGGSVSIDVPTADFAKLQQIKNSVCPDMPIYMAIGNHDLWPVGFNGSVSLDQMEQLICQNTVLPDGSHPSSFFYDFWIGNNHFVFVGDCGRDGNYVWLNADALQWLDNTINSGYEDGKNTFVFLHQGMPNTVSGTITDLGQSDGLIDNAYEVRQVLGKYPDAVMFSSHGHYELDSIGNAYSGDPNYPTVFNTSSVANPYSARVGSAISASEGYIMEIYDDYILLRGRDFSTGLWKPSSQYVILLNDDISDGGNENGAGNGSENGSGNGAENGAGNGSGNGAENGAGNVTENGGNDVTADTNDAKDNASTDDKDCCDCCPYKNQSEQTTEQSSEKTESVPESSGGCNSAIGFGSAAFAALVAGACITKRKREE